MQPSLSEQCEDSGRKFQNLSIKRNHIYTQLSKKKDEQCNNIVNIQQGPYGNKHTVT